MIWACEQFQEYLTGLSLHIETDHKPLVPLLSTKSLGEIISQEQEESAPENNQCFFKGGGAFAPPWLWLAPSWEF